MFRSAVRIRNDPMLTANRPPAPSDPSYRDQFAGSLAGKTAVGLR
ncbi:hypothetical protein [Kribbella deserti]|uniref:Uncharacterized protein n=1 Tax=Kribbella deserti TaxID=1926257 RepID=A0ABV6QJ77_9ACTN